MGSHERRNRAKESLREQIMAAAREMFVAEGFQNVSMRKIADRIEYSPTTIYLYFEDKSDLLHQICEQTFAKLAKNITAIQQLSGSPLNKLRNGLREYIHFGLAHPSEYELVFIAPLPGRPDDRFETSNGEIAFDTLRNVVSECMSAGLLKNNGVELTSQVLWAGIHGITSLLIKHKGFPFVEREKLVEAMLDTLIEGVKA